MENAAGPLRTDTASRVILASPHRLFRACLDPEMLAFWRAPDDMSARITRFRAAAGAGYRIALTASDPLAEESEERAPDHVADIRFVELLPDERIIEEVRFPSEDPAQATPMILTISFRQVVDGTKVTIAATNVPEAVRAEDHEAGFAASLRKLALLTE